MKDHVKETILYTAESIQRDIKRLVEAVKTKETPEPGVFLIQSWPGYDVQVDGCPLGMHCTYAQADAVATDIAAHRPQTDKMGYSRDQSRERTET